MHMRHWLYPQPASNQTNHDYRYKVLLFWKDKPLLPPSIAVNFQLIVTNLGLLGYFVLSPFQSHHLSIQKKEDTCAAYPHLSVAGKCTYQPIRNRPLPTTWPLPIVIPGRSKYSRFVGSKSKSKDALSYKSCFIVIYSFPLHSSTLHK